MVLRDYGHTIVKAQRYGQIIFKSFTQRFKVSSEVKSLNNSQILVPVEHKGILLWCK